MAIIKKYLISYYENKLNQKIPEHLVDADCETVYQGMLKAMGDSYMFSTCIHKENEYQYKNGLLSMWRAYGTDGGYAIEFDEGELKKMICNPDHNNTTISNKAVYTESSEVSIPEEFWHKIKNVIT